MPSNPFETEGSVALGAYWKDQLPDRQYQITLGIRLVRVLLILSITMVCVFGVFAGFLAIAFV